MRTGESDLQRVRGAIAELLRLKRQSNPRTWTETEAVRYRNLCELEQALVGVERLDAAAS